MTLPLLLVEERHEAYALWHTGIARGEIEPGGTTLIHCSRFQNLAPPRLRHPLPNIGADLATALGYVYSQLHIDDFILPGVISGFFDRVIWMHIGGICCAQYCHILLVTRLVCEP